MPRSNRAGRAISVTVTVYRERKRKLKEEKERVLQKAGNTGIDITEDKQPENCTNHPNGFNLVALNNHEKWVKICFSLIFK